MLGELDGVLGVVGQRVERVRAGDEESFYRIEDRFGYALSAKATGPDMQAMAREIYAQLQP